MVTLAEGRKAVACSHPLDPKSTQSLVGGTVRRREEEEEEEFITSGKGNWRGKHKESNLINLKR